MREKSYLSYDTSAVMKGIALIFMFIHHFFTFPNWYVEGISYPELAFLADHFCMPFKICVSVFAFLTGYFYYFAPNKNMKYSFRKITDFLIMYWMIYLPYLLAAVLLGYYDVPWTDAVLELFALKHPVMTFGWYVYFYTISMLILPVMVKLSEKNPARAVIFGILLPVIVCTVCMKKISNKMIYAVVNDMRIWFPCTAIGFIFGRFSLFENFFDDIFKEKIKKKSQRMILWLTLAVIVFIGRGYISDFTIAALTFSEEPLALSVNMDIVYAPVFIYAVANLLDCLSWKKILIPFKSIGKYSLHMWFLHCIFFNVCKEFTQPVLYLPHNPILVLLWGLLLCYAAARIVNIPAKGIVDLKNRCKWLRESMK